MDRPSKRKSAASLPSYLARALSTFFSTNGGHTGWGQGVEEPQMRTTRDLSWSNASDSLGGRYALLPAIGERIDRIAE